jgi:amidohydrolase
MTCFRGILVLLAFPSLLAAQSSRLDAEIDRRAALVEGKVVAWRRDIHAHPELSNREVRTAQIVADHLRALGLEVRTGVAHNGVVGVLRGGRPGRVVALRADMDALPVTEEVNVPFASKVRATYNGQDVGVMHACGHDAHVAILMGVAELLAGMKADLPGTVKFIFQPAEEGVPSGETGGAEMMIAEGALDNPRPGAIFGLHVFPYPAGEIHYRAGGAMASADGLRIVVRGRQTHGAQPWSGIDPIVVASQIVLGLQTITSRQVDITSSPAIVTVGAIHGGVRNNIIPDSVVMIGTIRAFDPAMRRDIWMRVRRTAEGVAQSAGAVAAVTIDSGPPVTYNDPTLTEQMTPTLRRVAGADKVGPAEAKTTAEDFSRYQEKIPGLFFFLGITPPGVDPRSAAPNHSPRFFVDEAALPVGVRALAHLAVDYLSNPPAAVRNPQ